MTQSFFSKLSLLMLAMALALGLLAQPALAQTGGSPETKFLSAVREGRGGEASKLMNERGGGLVNAQDDSSGDTALHITVGARNSVWVRYLLQNDADPNIANKAKITPLMLATQLGFEEGLEALLKNGAKLELQDRSGETALIKAVHLHSSAMVKLLLKAGANADKTDYTGQSARDYADTDPRARNIAEIFKNGVAAEPEKPAAGKLDFSGFEEKGKQ